LLTRRARLLKDPGDVRVSELKPVIPLVGVPWDWSTAGRPGARFAPSAIRSELLSLTPLLRGPRVPQGGLRGAHRLKGR